MPGPLARLYATLGLDSREFDTGLGKARKSVSGFGREVDLAIGVAAGAVTVGLLGTMNAARDWETAFTGVRKTVETTGMSAQQEAKAFGVLEDQLLDLSEATGVTSTELAGIAEMGGAMGIGIRDMEAFTETVALLSRTTNVASEEAAASLGKIGAVTGMAADDFDNFANALVALGNAGNSTEQQILEMANRMAGTASTIGLSTDELLGWSTAMADVGIEAEAGGTSFQRFAYTVQKAALLGGKHLDELAAITGMTGEEFTRVWQKDASEALAAVIEGLSELDDTAFAVAKGNLGFDDARLGAMIDKLTGNVGGLTETLERSERAVADNRAMTDEWGNVLGTTDNKVARFWASVNRAAIALGDGLVPVLTTVVEHGGNLVRIVGGLLEDFPALTAVVAPLATALSGLVAIRFGARALGLGAGFDDLLAKGLGKAWTGAAAASKGAITAAGAAAGKVYALAAVAAEKLMSAISAAWVAIGRPGSQVLMKATLAGSLTAGSYLAGIAKGLTVVGIAVIVGEAVNEGLRQAGLEPKPWGEVLPPSDMDDFEQYLRSEFGFKVGGGLTSALNDGIDTAAHQAMWDRLVPPDAMQQIARGVPGGLFTDMAASLREQMGVLPDAVQAVFERTRKAISEGFGSVKAALARPVRFISDEDRERNMLKRVQLFRERANAARRAGDTRSQRFYERGIVAQQVRLERFTRGQKDDAVEAADVVGREARRGANSAIREGNRTKRQLDAIDLVSVGKSWMAELAQGITEGTQSVVNAASLAAAATTRALTPTGALSGGVVQSNGITIAGNVYGGAAGLRQLQGDIDNATRPTRRHRD